MSEMIEKLMVENYTTEQVARAVGRTPQHWCRIRHKFVTQYHLPVVKLGRRHYYQKGPVDQMIEKLLQDGD